MSYPPPPGDGPRSSAFPARAVPVRVLPPLSTTAPTQAPRKPDRSKPDRTKHTPATTDGAEAARRPQRSDIQGLRALAVVAVILNHLTGWPRGGFVGVDVFFVISGFLVTGMLLRDGERVGAASLPRFYLRRAIRLLPAALVVLGLTVLGARLLFNQTRAASVLADAQSALALVSNWHFAAIGTDYFHAQGAVSPLQHFWSLSVEEQFYLVWPAVVMIAFAVVAAATGRRAGGRTLVGVLAAVAIVASFVWALAAVRAEPTVAYFSTFSRIWELGAGALLAAIAPVFARLSPGTRGVMGWLGLIGILASFAVIDDTVAFPAPWAALPVIATALVLAAGTGGEQKYLVPLQNPVATFLGDISYSLYLWHAPAIAFLLVFVPTQTPIVTAGVGVVILALSTVMYFLVEQPLHRSPLARSFDAPEARSAAWTSWRERIVAQMAGSALGLGAIVLLVALVTNSSFGASDLLASAQRSQTTPGTVQAELQAAVDATSWPALSPSLDDVMTTGSLDNPARSCFDVVATPDPASCTWGLSTAPHHMYLVGDSTALAYAPAFKAIAEASGGQWRITTMGLFGCRFTEVTVQSDDANAVAQCASRKDSITQHILSDRPDLVVISNDFTEAQGTDGSALGVAQLVASAASQAARLQEAGRIVYLAPPPLGADLSQCYTTLSSPQACTSGIDPTWSVFLSATEQVAAATHDHVVSSLPFSCVDGRCPPFAGTLPTRFDAVHMTTAWSTHVAPVIQQEFVEQKLL